MKRALHALIERDGQADRIVPPSGFTAHLTLFAAAAMAFLAVFALSLSLSTGRLSKTWTEDLAQAATLHVKGAGRELDQSVETALSVLQTTPGVTRARALTDADQQTLLAPWLGAEVDVKALPLPRLIEMTIDPRSFDAEALRLRLSAEVPTAVLEDHALWRAPLLETAAGLRVLGWIAMLLITCVLTAIVTLAATAALAANAKVISVLRLIGATDDYIAGAFIRRFTARAALGAAGGLLLGLIALLFLPSGGQEIKALSVGFRFQGAEWILPLFIPVLTAAVACLATAYAARTALEELS